MSLEKRFSDILRIDIKNNNIYKEEFRSTPAGCHYLLLIILLMVFPVLRSKAQADLPDPPSNIQSIAAGSFIVPMDNNYQSIVPAGQAPFNLKAYGLINEFLQNGIPVKWAIRAGKILNDIDFTATAERFSPSFVAGASLSFRGGPFIVPDTVLPCGLSTREIISSFGNNVSVYKLVENIQVDIRYTLTHRPKIAVFNNGGNQVIHTKILDAAGIEDYDIMDAADIADLINCYTFASEPHADNKAISPAVISGIRAFVMNGGNFLAQCHAIDAYENQGFYLTTSGMSIVNTTVSHNYPNADLAFSQMHGTLRENEGGSVHNFTLRSGSEWRSFVYPSVTHLGTETVVAIGAHLIPPSSPGGNIFYLGGHDYSKGKNAPDLTTLSKVNALRMYLNGVFVPSGRSNGAWANAGLPSLIAGCEDGVVLGCTPTGPPGSTFLWTPSEGLSCTTCPNPVARPSVSTTYKVLVTNGCTATDSVRVEVGPKPEADFGNNTVCQGASTDFTDQSVNATFWHWDFGDPASGINNTSSLQNPSHTFSTSGSFKVTLIAGTTATCADTMIRTVVVDPLPVLTVNAPGICSGQQVTLTVDGATTYSWSSGESAASITVTPDVTTTYTVTGTTGNCTSQITATVTVVPPIEPLVDVTDVNCEGGSDGSALVTLTGGMPDYSYSWNTVPVQTTPEAINLPKGTYTVTITDAAGCSAVAVAEIKELYPLPEVKFSIEGEGCAPSCIKFTDSSTASSDIIQQWSWNFGDGSASDQQNPVHCFQQSGSYNVSLKVVSDKGCAAASLANGLVRVYPSPSLDLGPDQKICSENQGDTKITFDAGPGSHYLWQPTGDTTRHLTTSKAGTYSVTVTNDLGCSATASVNIKEVCPPRLFVGNAFSPDGDGINDYYIVHSAHVGKFQLLIFNRWGEIIFESRDKDHHWDGIYREEPMPIGTYPWVLVYEGDSVEYRGPYRLEGSVTVVR